jgi:hypothetical protein
MQYTQYVYGIQICKELIIHNFSNWKIFWADATKEDKQNNQKACVHVRKY